MANQILIELRDIINNAYSDVSDKSNNYEILKKVLKEIKHKSNNEESVFSNLFKDAVYIVINRAPISKDEKRAFLAGINSVNVREEVLNKIKKEVSPKRNTQHFANAYLLDNDSQNKSILEGKFRNFWLHKWEEYSDLTDSTEHFTTLNQSLLKYVEHSLNIGIYWGNEDLDNQDYIKITNSLIQDLGLGNVDDKNWQLELLEKARYVNVNDIVIKKQRDRDIVKKIEKLYKKMQPSNTDVKLDDKGVVFILYHLIRSYSFWGGNSFLSIPISFGIKSNISIPIQSAVLSICSTKPITGIEYYKWTIIANKMFKELIFDDVSKLLDEKFKFEYQIKEIGTSYSMGHFLKNRMKPISYSLTNLKSKFRDNDKIKESLDEKIYDKLYNEYIKKAYSYSLKLNNVGYLMDLFSQLLSFKYNKRNTQIENFFTSSPDVIERFTNKKEDAKNFNISKYFKDNNELLYDYEFGYTQQVKVVLINDSFKAEIVPFIDNKECLYRPFNAIYEELFNELMINTAKYGKKDGNGFSLLNVEFGKNYIFFNNEITEEKYKNIIEGQENIDKGWIKIEDSKVFKKTGGLDYLSNIINISNIAEMNIRLEKKEKEESLWFKIKIKFKGYERA